MSLSRAIKKQAHSRKNNNVQDLKQPELERENTISYDLKQLETALKTLKEPEPDPVQKSKYLFISDSKHKCISDFKITMWNNSMINRSISDIAKHVESLWICLNNRQAKRWLESYIGNNTSFVSILVRSGSKYNKYMDDLGEYCDIITKKHTLDKVNALSLEELVDMLSSRIDIHSPANVCASFLGCSKKIKKKRKN